MGSAVRRARLRSGTGRFGGTVRTVIGLSGTVVRLADPGAGTVTEITLAELMPVRDFERAGARSPAAAAGGPLDGLPEGAVAEALWWERHIVEVLRGLPPDAPPGTSRSPSTTRGWSADPAGTGQGSRADRCRAGR